MDTGIDIIYLDWQIDVLIGVLSAFAAIVTLRLMSWVMPRRSLLLVSGRRVMMPRDPPEIIGQRMADAVVDWAEDLVYRKVLTPEKALFAYEMIGNVLGDKDYLPKGEKLLRERLDTLTNPPVSTSEALSGVVSNLKTIKRG